jgi:putative ABC transport system permease protein
VYSEIVLPDDQMQAFRANRAGAIVGRSLAEALGWQVGDRVPIQATIWTKKDGGRSWEFDLEGIFETSDPRGSDALFLFHYEYFDEAREFGQGTIGWYILSLSEGANGIEVANLIDEEFANSPAETETSTEQAFAASFAAQLGNIGMIVNTMAQSVRERINELAVLKTVGFRDGTVLSIVIAESVLIMADRIKHRYRGIGSYHGDRWRAGAGLRLADRNIPQPAIRGDGGWWVVPHACGLGGCRLDHYR